jgi:hypothetical protein
VVGFFAGVMADAAIGNMEAGEAAVVDGSGGQQSSPSNEDGVYMCATNSHNRQFQLTRQDLVGVAREVIETVDLDNDGHITFSEVIHQVGKRFQAENRTMWMHRLVAALVTGIILTVGLSATANVISVQKIKDFSVVDCNMVDLKGRKVRTSSTETGLRADGQLCPLDAFGQCLPGIVQTGEARSYASLFDLPLLDSRALSALRELTVVLQDGQELTLSIVGSLKHTGGRSATFFSPSGNKVVVDSSTITALVVVEGQRHVVHSNLTQGRRLQGQHWQPRLYHERDFFTAENGFDVVLDTQTGHHLRRRLAANSGLGGWASLALSIAEAVVGFYEDSQDRRIQQHASITGRLTVTSSGVSTELGVAILYNKTSPSSSRLRLAYGNQAWLVAYGQLMEFAYIGGDLHSCEALSNPSVPQVIQNAASLVEADGMLMVFTEENESDQITMEILSFEFDVVAAILQIPETGNCLMRENTGNGTQSGRRLEMELLDGWKIARATYSPKLWFEAYGQKDALFDDLPAEWHFDPKAVCSGSQVTARIAKNDKAGIMAVSFAVSAYVPKLVRKVFKGEEGVGPDMDKIITDGVGSLSTCIAKGLAGAKAEFVIGHGLGGACAVAYYKSQGVKGTLTSSAEVVTYGATPTGSGECSVPGTRYLHVNDPLGSPLFEKSSKEHEVANGKIYKDLSARRRWKTWDRRRTVQWEWTDECTGKSSDSFSDVDSVLTTFHHNYANWS